MKLKPNLAITALTIIAALAAASLGGGATRAQTAFFDGAQDPASKKVMQQAEADIEKYRKGDFTLRFVDEKGREIKNAAANIELHQHQFIFGTILRKLMPMPDDSKLKREALKAVTDIFNTAIVAHYWEEEKPGASNTFDTALKEYEWATRHGLRTRFHAILYNVPQWFPTDKKLTEKDYWDMIEKRIKNVAKHFAGKIPEFDVMNEMFIRKSFSDSIRDINPAFPDFTDPAVAKRIYDIARKHLPDAKLVLLEVNPDARAVSAANPSLRTFVDYAKAVRDLGGVFDYVGTQEHFFTEGAPFQDTQRTQQKDRFTMAALSKRLDMLKRVGVPAVITEFNGPSRNNKKPKAEQNKLWTMTDAENSAWQINYYKLAFSKPHIVELTRWYQVDNMNGRGMDAGIVDASGNKKQIYHDLKKLIKEEWHTKLAARTDAKGAMAFRGFYGDYDIKIEGYKPARVRLYDDNKDKTVEVVLVK